MKQKRGQSSSRKDIQGVIYAIMALIVFISLAALYYQTRVVYTPTVPTRPPTRTPRPTVDAFGETRTYYARGTGSIPAYRCPDSACEIATRYGSGDPVYITGQTTGGSVNGSRNWYVLMYANRPAYIPVSSVIPSAPLSSQRSNASSGCPSTSATCSQLTCEQAYACLAAGNGRLDRDNDGVPCESVCPGG